MEARGNRSVVSKERWTRSVRPRLRQLPQGGVRVQSARRLRPSESPAVVRRPSAIRNREPSAVASDCTSRQRNTHSTEARAVHYPWHPWQGRTVVVYEAVTKGGSTVCRCGFDERRHDRSLEVPAWMFEPAACDHLRLTDTPAVDCRALADLTRLLQPALRADVLQAQHPSFSAIGDADATVPNPSPILATDALSSATAPAALSEPPSGDSGQDDPTAGPPAPSAGRPAARRRRAAGGAS